MSAELLAQFQIISNLTAPMGLVTGQSPLTLTNEIAYSDGAGAGQIQHIWSDKASLAPGSNRILNLYSGMVDAFGNAVTFTRLRLLYLASASANLGDLSIGAAASSPFYAMFNTAGSKVYLKPGAMLVLATPDATGYPVTAGNANLQITAEGAATVTYSLILAGS